MKIVKKVRSKYFRASMEGRKQFEIRLANFRCKEGDTLILKEQEDKTGKLTGRKLNCEILYKFNTKNLLKYYKKEDIDRYGFMILAIRRKYKYKSVA